MRISKKEALVCLLIGIVLWLVNPETPGIFKSAHGLPAMLGEMVGGIIGGFLFVLIFLIICKLIAMGFRYVVRRRRGVKS